MKNISKIETNKNTRNTAKKISFEEQINEVEIKNREKLYFENVFKDLCALEKEPSSDENSKEKKYLREIEEKVKVKKMKIQNNGFKSKTMSIAQRSQNKKKNKLKEDDEDSKILPPPGNKKYLEDSKNGKIDLYKDPEKEEEKLRHERFGKKALRKIFKKLTGTFNKKDIELMIWEVDTNLNGYISFDEYEKMYKRCVIDKKELEPKKLYTLVQFLMFDKEHKGYITEEDTLEVLCVRNNNGLDNAINDIFMEEIKDEKGKIIRTKNKRETINYEEFSERMHSLSLRQRTLFMNKKKNFCEKIKEEAIQNSKLKQAQKLMEGK
jgi:Ca2+-binding EF-hand superfamily protein